MTFPLKLYHFHKLGSRPFLAGAGAQAYSLREICGGLAATEGKLKHLGLSAAPQRPTFFYANGQRPWQLFETVFQQLLGKCRGQLGLTAEATSFGSKTACSVSMPASSTCACRCLTGRSFSAPKAPSSCTCCWTTIGRALCGSSRCAPSGLALPPPAATQALEEWIALNERSRLRPVRHPRRRSQAVARSPGLSKTSDRWRGPPRTQ